MAKKRRKRGVHFAPVFLTTLRSDEWKRLTKSEQLVYINIKARYNGSNNGIITCYYSELKKQFSSATISKALKGLVEKGWIEITQKGGLYRYSNQYRLTCKYDRIFEL